MRTFGKWLGRVLLTLIFLVAALWLLGPREPVDVDVSFDPAKLDDDLDAYLQAAEADVPNLNPAVAKRIQWAGETGAKTQVSVVYIHGFSATSQEIRPVPDRVAETLNANLYFARLSGHGRDGAAMAEPTARDWMEDTAEALAIGRALGGRVLVVTTSTGGSLMALAALDPEMSANVAGIVFVSGNFRLNNPLAPLLTWPAARHYLPLVAGKERSFRSLNDAHGQYWTTRYPSAAVFPMAALVKAAREADYSTVSTPALFLVSPDDQVVSAEENRKVAARWGKGAKLVEMSLGEDDDPFRHVILGDILSPGQNEAGVETILQWFDTLP